MRLRKRAHERRKWEKGVGRTIKLNEREHWGQRVHQRDREQRSREVW